MRYIREVKRSRRSARATQVFAELKRFLPGPTPGPFRLHAATPDFLDAYWQQLRDVYLTGEVPREHKDVIAAAVSQTNRCPYCVEAHSTMVGAWQKDEITRAVLEDRPELVDDPELRALVRWSLSTLEPEAPIVRQPPFGPDDGAEIIGIAVAFHYTNRMANVFLDENPFPIPDVPGVKGLLMWMARPMLKKAAHFRLEAPPEPAEGPPLPADLLWAEPRPLVRAAFARLAQEAERCGRRSVPGAARTRVERAIDRWTGSPMPLGRGWLGEHLEGLAEDEAAVATVALLTALSSWSLTDEDVQRAKPALDSDVALLETCIWAAFTAARRVGTWLGANAK